MAEINEEERILKQDQDIHLARIVHNEPVGIRLMSSEMRVNEAFKKKYMGVPM